MRGWLKTANGEDVEMGDVLVSLVLEANPELTNDEVDRLVNKYQDVVWARAEEVFRGA